VQPHKALSKLEVIKVQPHKALSKLSPFKHILVDFVKGKSTFFLHSDQQCLRPPRSLISCHTATLLQLPVWVEEHDQNRAMWLARKG